MWDSMVPDISEDAIGKLDKRILECLLLDRTTREPILWATEDYADLGPDYQAGCRIRPHLITGANSNVIQPRVLKAMKQKKDRTRQRAEVFTPSWVCNAQNNLVDAEWFDGKAVFNVPAEKGWKTIPDPVPFPEKGSKTWKRYVDCKRLEMTCGEAPYLVSRYDTVTGLPIPVRDRIGLLDRKLRVVGENAASEDEWRVWARRKKKKERTREEEKILAKEREMRKKQQALFDLLRNISIRLPMLIFGSAEEFDESVRLADFIDIVDDISWKEFMPKDVDKELFRKLLVFYDEDVIEGAGMKIRRMAKAADELMPTQRILRIAEIFSCFRNPTKETVLTPWRVVNMHMGDTVGG